MTKAKVPAMGRKDSSVSGSWPAWMVVALVLIAAVYAFSPRSIPSFPVTQIHPADLLVNGIARNGTRLVAVGEQGHILIADQVSGPWQEAKVEPQRGSTLTQATFLKDGVALAVGHDGWILRSEDQGNTWHEVAYDAEKSEPFLGVAGPYNGKLFAVGGFGRYMVSQDNGKTWQDEKHSATTDHHLNAITQIGDGSLLLVGERGLMLRSTDNGANWSLLPSIYTGSFFGVLPLPNNSVLAYGMRGNAFVSADNGRTWKKSEIKEVISLFGGAVTPEGDIVLVGASNAIFVSKDGGAHFVRVSRENRHGLTSVIPLGNGQWLTGGEGGIALRSSATTQEAATTGVQP